MFCFVSEKYCVHHTQFCCSCNVSFCRWHAFLLSVYPLILSLTTPLLSFFSPHLWRAAYKDSTSKCLMNKAAVIERQTLCAPEVLCLLYFKGLSISGHTQSFNDYHIQTGQDTIWGYLRQMTSHPSIHVATEHIWYCLFIQCARYTHIKVTLRLSSSVHIMCELLQ